MTIFEGICDEVREKPGHWPSDMSTEASRAEVTHHFLDKLTTLEVPDIFRMRCLGLNIHWPHAVYFRVLPATLDESKKLRGLRDSLAGRLGLRHAIHEEYPFHVTLCYLIAWMSSAEQAAFSKILGDVSSQAEGMEFVLGRPEFCEFDDLTHFERLRYLGANSANS